MCAHTVFQFHLASQANLYAALSWTLVNLLTQPAALASRVVEEHERLCRDFGPLYAAPPLSAPHTLTGIARSRWRSGKLLQFRSHLRSQVPQRHGGVRKEPRVACAGARAALVITPNP
jgi:hypothetical protein